MARITSKITSIEADDITGSIAKQPTLETDTARKTDDIVPKRVSQAIVSTSLPNDAMPTPAINIEPIGFGWVRIVGIITTILWIALVAALLFFVLQVQDNWQVFTALQWLSVAALIIGPALMIFVGMYALGQLSKLSGQTVKLTNIAERMMSPDDTVIGKSKTMAAAIKEQVDDVNQKLASALGRLATMEDMLNTQTGSLAKANEDATNTAEGIATSLSAQSTALDQISGTFDTRMGALSTMITKHTDKLTKATQIAEQKLKEARISVEGATAKINSASDVVRSNTVQATSTLAASHKDIQSLGDIIKQRSLELDEVYKKHASELTEMIEQLRDEQQVLGANLEERLSKMRDLSLSAQASAESLVMASEAGKDTVQALAQSASLADTAVKARFSEMKEMVRYSNEHAQDISDKAAQRVKDALELTRLEITRIEQDMSDLQSKINMGKLKSLELVEDMTPQEKQADETPDVSPETPAPTKKRKWTRLKLKPILDEAIEDAIEIPEIPSNELHDETPVVETKTTLDNNTIDNISHIAPQIEDDASEIQPLDLYVDPSSGELNSELDPITEAIRRAVPQDHEYTQTKAPKSKSGFSLRGLFGSRDNDKNDSLSMASKPPSIETAENSPASDDRGEILKELGLLGLSPNVVVDDGCIIEAANSRVAQGHEAMSRAVINRLNEPIKHLASALASDTILSNKAIEFASTFDRKLEIIAGNREAIRTRLEGEYGRAYLLCDAALNYGHI